MSAGARTDSHELPVHLSETADACVVATLLLCIVNEVINLKVSSGSRSSSTTSLVACQRHCHWQCRYATGTGSASGTGITPLRVGLPEPGG